LARCRWRGPATHRRSWATPAAKHYTPGKDAANTVKVSFCCAHNIFYRKHLDEFVAVANAALGTVSFIFFMVSIVFLGQSFPLAARAARPASNAGREVPDEHTN